MKRFVSHIILLNVLAITIWWIFTDDSPERVEVTVDTTPGLVLQSDCKRGCSFSGAGVQTSCFWLPSGFRQKEFILRGQKVPKGAKIKSATIRQRLLLEQTWSYPAGQPISVEGAIKLTTDKCSPGLSRLGIAILAASELLFCLLALFFVWFSNKLPVISKRTELVSSLVVSFAAAFFCLGVVPVQTLLANSTELDISLASVLIALAWRVVVATLVLWVLLYWSTCFSRTLYLVFIVALIAYEYLETGVLSIGCPALNGDMEYYKNISRMVLDACVLPVCVVAVFIAFLFFRATLIIVPCAICLLGLSSLLDVRSESSAGEHSDIAPLKPKSLVVKESVYSGQRNILVYVLDCTATSYLLEIFAENPSFADALPGFTFYTNHLGMYGGTSESVAALSTGRALTDVNRAAEYAYSTFSDESFLAKYLDGSSAVFCSPGSFTRGISVGGTEGGDEANKGSECALSKRKEDQQAWSLMDIVKFRMLPFGCKYADWVVTTASWNIDGNPNKEDWVYPLLQSAPIVDELPLALQIYHTIGDHPAYGISRTGVDDGIVREGHKAKVDKLWYAWSQLTILLEKLKERCLYDKSMIVITADHGNEGDNDHMGCALREGVLTSRAWPIMLVKPIGAQGPLRKSSIATSHIKFHDLMMCAYDKCLSADEVTKILQCENRFYRYAYGGGFNSVRVDAEGKCSVNFEPSRVDVTAKPIESGRQYNLVGHAGETLPIQFENMRRWEADGPLHILDLSNSEFSVGKMRFRVANGKHCNVILELAGGAGMKIKDVESSNMIVVPHDQDATRGKYEITAAPAPDGLVSLELCATNSVALYSITVR